MTPSDTGLLPRVRRFLLTVGLPVAVALSYGTPPWLVYATLCAIQAFVGDEGGGPWKRLAYMAIGPAGLMAGDAIGTATSPWPMLFLGILFVLGIFYGLVQGGHNHLIQLVRFAGYGLVMGYSVAPLHLPDCAAAAAAVTEAWAISLLSDLARGRLRPLGVTPVGQALRAALIGWRTCWTFALCAGFIIVASDLAGAWLGLGHPYWATLTILVVLRRGLIPSADSVSDRVLGTLMGIAAVALLVTVAPGKGSLLAGMILAAGLRWPALRMHVVLGTALITVFVLLLGELLTAAPGAAGHLLQDRLLATMLGCCFSMAGMGLYQNLQRLLALRGIAAER